jgi:hypothetical protein
MHDLHDNEDRNFNAQQSQLQDEILHIRKIMANGSEIIREFRKRVQELNLEYLNEDKRQAVDIIRDQKLVNVLREIVRGTNIQI